MKEAGDHRVRRRPKFVMPLPAQNAVQRSDARVQLRLSSSIHPEIAIAFPIASGAVYDRQTGG